MTSKSHEWHNLTHFKLTIKMLQVIICIFIKKITKIHFGEFYFELSVNCNLLSVLINNLCSLNKGVLIFRRKEKQAELTFMLLITDPMVISFQPSVIGKLTIWYFSWGKYSNLQRRTKLLKMKYFDLHSKVEGRKGKKLQENNINVL